MNKAVLFLLTFFFALPQLSIAAEEIRHFDAHITPYADGSFSVVEKIIYDFGESKRHGIYRHITKQHPQPASAWYKQRSIDIELSDIKLDGEISPYTVTESKEVFSIKIGDPDSTISGAHEYTITYRVHGGLSYYDNNITELYWNVTGHEWEVPIRRVDARVDATTDLLVPRRFCYAGTLGETQSCEAVIATSTYVAFSARFQGLGSGLTIAQELDPKKVEKEIVEKVPLWLTLGSGGLIWLVALGWFVYYRKTALRPDVPIVPQYEPPPNCGPMFAGVLIDGHLHSRDITAGLLYLAQKGFISIKHSSDTVALFFTVSDYEITLRRAPGEVESGFLLQVLHLLFAENDVVGSTTRLSALKRDQTKRQRNAKEVSQLQTAIVDDLVERGYFERALTIPVAIILMLLVLIVAPRLLQLVIDWNPLYIFFCVTLVLTMLVAVGFAYQRRTRKGHEAAMHLKGFRDFLSVTEKERLTFHNAPQKNAEQFMKYLPYAVAFGVEKEWADVFKDIQIVSPDWYEGNTTTFSAVALSRDIGAFSSSFTASTSSPSGSGSSGGGFSAGGAGGGGGGSW